MKRSCYNALLIASFGWLLSCHQAGQPPPSPLHFVRGAPLPLANQPAPAGSPVRLQNAAGMSIDFFVSENAFDLYSRHLYDQIILESDYRKIDAGKTSVASGTNALELKRVRHIKRIGDVWYDKVKVQLTSGPLAGKQGYIISDCVVRAK